MAEETQEQTPQQSAEAPAEQAEEEKGPANEVQVEDAGTLKKKITVTVPREKIDAKFEEMFGELGTTAQVPGFRIGRAPRRLIEKRFGKEVSEDVRNALLGESLGDAIDKSELKTLGEPEIDLEAIELPASGELSFSFEVEVMPEFALPELKAIKVEKHLMEVTPQRIDEYMEQLRLGRAGYEETDGAAAEGDIVQAGAKVTGEGMEPFERPGLSLRVAPGQIEGLPLVDMGKALAGKKAGDTASLKIKVPDAHPNENWRGKEANVEISIGQVRRRILPELDDEFAAGAGFESLKEMREFVSSRLKARTAAEVRRNMRQQVCQYLLDGTSFDLPEGLVNRHTARLLRRRYVDLLSQGILREQIDERITELQAAAAEQARRDLQLSLILAKIADDEKLEVTDDEVNSRVAQIAALQNRRPERMRQEFAQDGTMDQLKETLREERVLDKLLEQANVTEAKEAPAEKEKKAARPAAAKKGPARKAAKKAAKKASPKSKKKSDKQ